MRLSIPVINYVLFGITAGALLTPAVSAADNLEALKAKQEKLEVELANLRVLISTLEAKPVESGPESPKPFWYVTKFGIDEVNSAGGVEPYFIFHNPNESNPIKYIRLRVSLYNAVGDAVSSDIGNRGTAGLSFTGPLANSDGDKRSDWGPIWYNSTGHCIKVESIQVTFVNGKSTSFSGKELKRALNPSITNECKIKRL